MNIIEILKDCPEGTKLYSPLLGEVELDGTAYNKIWVVYTTKNKEKHKDVFFKDGTYFQHVKGECLLFPSKDNKDWDNFVKPNL